MTKRLEKHQLHAALQNHTKRGERGCHPEADLGMTHVNHLFKSFCWPIQNRKRDYIFNVSSFYSTTARSDFGGALFQLIKKSTQTVKDKTLQRQDHPWQKNCTTLHKSMNRKTTYYYVLLCSKHCSHEESHRGNFFSRHLSSSFPLFYQNSQSFDHRTGFWIRHLSKLSFQQLK